MTTTPTTPEPRIAFITGGSRGLGRAFAERLAADGFHVAISYARAADAAVEVVSGIEARGGRAFAVQGDVSTLAGIDAMFAALDRELEVRTGAARFDVLVNNAGVLITGSIDQATEADFDAMFNTNVKGAFFTIQRALERLRDGGRIINLGSGLTRVANPMYPAYSATKGAVDVLTRILAHQLGARGITVNTLAPGAIDTDLNPWLKSEQGQAMIAAHTALGRCGHTDDIADAVAFLASPASRWITGERIEASGGMKLG